MILGYQNLIHHNRTLWGAMSEVFGAVDNLTFQMGIRHTLYPVPNVYLVQIISRAKCLFGTIFYLPCQNVYLVPIHFSYRMLIWYIFFPYRIPIHFSYQHIWYTIISIMRKWNVTNTSNRKQKYIQLIFLFFYFFYYIQLKFYFSLNDS